MNNYIINAIKKFLLSLNNFPVYVFIDSNFDISSSLECSINTVTSSTEFILNSPGGLFLSDTEDFLLNRYLKFGTESKLITEYDNTTGEVLIESAFMVAPEVSDEVFVEVVDCLYIDIGATYQTTSRLHATQEAIPILLRLQTKNDSNRKKLFNYIMTIKGNIRKNKNSLPIYDDLGNIKGYMKIVGNISDNVITNDGEQLQTSIISFVPRYTYDYSQI